MKAIYNNKEYRAEFQKRTWDVELYSRLKDEGFQNYIDAFGNKHDDFFTKIIPQACLSYLWEMLYQVKYKERWYNLDTVLNYRTIMTNYYEIRLDFREHELAEQLGFERPDKFYYAKRLSRLDIEALKVIESPQGIFGSQGNKVQILTGQEIDDYLLSIVRDKSR